ncbi:mrna capping [Stylonychia lemnae]|uniref:mRNA guanylyltransferase n=1 Tax=Stylonychia lemnae TaxID=5949 RepID=A0A078B1L0_STYLE|nr:mrna capping [Stylonychia lemnae]|eukprot:CDW87158.1 mrna capping [Stylonychia lemnae]
MEQLDINTGHHFNRIPLVRNQFDPSRHDILSLNKGDSQPQVNLETYGKGTSKEEQDFIRAELKKIFSITKDQFKKDYHQLLQTGYDQDLLNKIIKAFELRDWGKDFPGAQPVSFQQKDVYQLQQNKYIVCEKTDGLRYFLIETNKEEFFIVDRQFNIRKVKPRDCDFRQKKNTLIVNIFDGELVLDKFQQDVPIYLVFDAMLVNGYSCMMQNFQQRLINAHNEVKRRIREPQILRLQNTKNINSNGQVQAKNVVDIYMKDMFEVKYVQDIIQKIIPRLQHDNDGLIFTQDQCPYYPGTCQEILKWKPKHLNSIDFVIKMISCHRNSEYLWGLYTYTKDKMNPNIKQLQLFDFIFFEYHQSDPHDVNDNERMRALMQSQIGKPVVIECSWDEYYNHPHQLVCNKLKQEFTVLDNPNIDAIAQNFRFDILLRDQEKMKFRGGWRFLKHRSERVDPNATKSAKSVLNSIHNGLEQEDLIIICNDSQNDFNRGSDIKRKRSEDDNAENVRKQIEVEEY